MSNYLTAKNTNRLQKLSPKHLSIHVNFLRGKAILPHKKIPSLTREDNTFYPLPLFCVRLFTGYINQQDIRKELLAQLENLQRFKLKVKYLDSEQHIHTLPVLRPLIYEIAANNNISIRSTKSSLYYLLRKPLRLLIFMGLQVAFGIQALVYNQKIPVQPMIYHAGISHPGTNYD